MTDYPDFFDGTARPAWAGPVRIATQPFKQSRAFSDSRHTGMAGIRPTRIEGVIVPVTTRGRQRRIAVPGRDLASTNQDVGHLFALSSGGPEVSVQYVPQHHSINRAALATGGPVANEDLNWRQLEVYAQYCAFRGQQSGAVVLPARGERVTIQTNAQPFALTVNGAQLIFPATATYQGMPRPAVLIRWTVIPVYRNNGTLARGNDPAMISVTLSYAQANNNWTDFCTIDFRNNPKFVAVVRDLMRPEKKLQIRMKGKRVVIAYAQAHPRRLSGGVRKRSL